MTIAIAVAFLGGAVLWSFMEYVLHRFAFHLHRGKNYGSREHLRHHARRDYSLHNAWQAWAGVLVVGLGLVNVLVRLAVGPAAGWAAGVGYVVGYGYYELVHAAAHLWAPRTRYGRWVRLSHFHHHFAEPLRNQGVTSPVWDLVFGTYTSPGPVTVPRRMAMVWLLDDNGEVKPQFQADYAVRGTRPADFEPELVRAYANLAPEY